ncbi:MAG: threonine synthase [Bacillota bacterium]|nr:threonine synthase [Bacillota bacterium]
MLYQSTRGKAERKSAAQAIIKGIAEDRGLYVPVTLPRLSGDLTGLAGMDYRQLAYEVMSLFLTDYTEEELKSCIDRAYDEKFDTEEIAPVQPGGDAWFIELYHGKTAAFKDMALALLPYLLTTAMKKEGEDKTIVILTATSGDTGKAALEGFADVPGTEIIVFFPEDGVSQVQKRQMTTQEGSNTHVFGIHGNFDDAQTGVKGIFNDDAFNRELGERGYKLSSANSINVGRLVPQVVYYVWSYVKLLERGAVVPGEKINIVVPTGNFGNILAAYYAGQAGVPVNRFICASNANKVLTDFLNTGVYDIHREFYVTNSPSMDILISSNLERLLFHLSGGDGDEISRLMEALEKEKRYQVSDKIRAGLADFYGGYADELMTNAAIGRMYEKHGYLMDTHTAVGYCVYENYKILTGDETATVIASTASAYKFADSVAASIGLSGGGDGFEAIRSLHKATGSPVPEGLRDLEDKPVRHKGVVEKDGLTAAVRESLE